MERSLLHRVLSDAKQVVNTMLTSQCWQTVRLATGFNATSSSALASAPLYQRSSWLARLLWYHALRVIHVPASVRRDERSWSFRHFLHVAVRRGWSMPASQTIFQTKFITLTLAASASVGRVGN
jgi:hypothetical protein